MTEQPADASRRPQIQQPVPYPSTELEMIDYIVWNTVFYGVSFFDTDEYYDVECNYACEQDFELEEYDTDDQEGRWPRHLESLARQAHLKMADVHAGLARELRMR